MNHRLSTGDKKKQKDIKSPLNPADPELLVILQEAKEYDESKDTIATGTIWFLYAIAKEAELAA